MTLAFWSTSMLCSRRRISPLDRLCGVAEDLRGCLRSRFELGFQPPAFVSIQYICVYAQQPDSKRRASIPCVWGPII
jgi:hypothetical protein